MIWCSHKQDPWILNELYPTLMHLMVTPGSRQHASDIWYKFCELCLTKKRQRECEGKCSGCQQKHSDKAHKPLTQKLLAPCFSFCCQPSQGCKICLQFGILHLHFLQLYSQHTPIYTLQ